MLRVSIVIPTYEEDGLDERLDVLRAHLRALPYAFEILIVDDSGPENRARADAYANRHEDVRVIAGERRGKGAAVKLGVLESTGSVVFTIDADLPVALERIQEFVERVRSGADVVVAERPFDRNLANPVRFIASRVLFVAQKWIVLGDRFHDTQCGFKAFRGDVARSLARRQIVDGGMYDIEYLLIATREGLRIERVPVTQLPSPRPSKIRTLRALASDPRDLARIKLHALRGRY